MDENRLFVSNLAYSITEEALAAHLLTAGPVRSVRIVHDRDTGRSRGFAFAEMETGGGLLRAIDLLDGSELRGRPMKLVAARPRAERPMPPLSMRWSYDAGAGVGPSAPAQPHRRD
ncbi:MAG: RNA-binding protein [Chloroflexota bacterium]|nr:RNA-binding protein [Chloroflexota bacterium]